MGDRDWPAMEQEEKLSELFQQLDKLLRKTEKTKNPDKMHNLLKDVTNKLKESKALLKDFEREARTDGMPAELLSQRKKVLADALNTLIQRKKEVGQAATKDELFAGAVEKQEENLEQMSVQQLIHKGKRDMADTDAALNRAERLVEDTLQTGTQTAGALGDQTQQLNKIVDDLADIEFNVKKASKVIRDITRGLLTDKCIGFLLFAAVAGVICIIVLKVVNPRKKNIQDGINTLQNTTLGQQLANGINDAQNSINNGINNAAGVGLSPPAAGRRMLKDVVQQLLDKAARQSIAIMAAQAEQGPDDW